MAKRTRAERRAHRQRRLEKHFQCDRRIGFKTVEEAEAAIGTTPKAGYRPLHVYKCSFCPRFHIGHVREDLNAACD